MNILAKTLGVGLLGFALVATPFAALAHNDSDTPKVKNGTAVEVAIAEGSVLVRGAKVTANSGGTITAQTLWTGATMTWTVTTDANTKYYTKLDNTATLAQFAVGDTISFAGTFTGSGMTVKAAALNDWTLEANTTTLSGKVTATAANALTLGERSPAVSLQLAGGATVTLKNGGSIALSSVVAGDTVKAVGTYNADKTVFTATSVVVSQKAAQTSKRWDAMVKGWFSGHKFFNFNR